MNYPTNQNISGPIGFTGPIGITGPIGFTGANGPIYIADNNSNSNSNSELITSTLRARPIGVTAARYYDWITKYDKTERMSRENSKPDCCDICSGVDCNIQFVNEPFCSEILEIEIPFWMCDACYENSRQDL